MFDDSGFMRFDFGGGDDCPDEDYNEQVAREACKREVATWKAIARRIDQLAGERYFAFRFIDKTGAGEGPYDAVEDDVDKWASVLLYNHGVSDPELLVDGGHMSVERGEDLVFDVQVIDVRPSSGSTMGQ